MTKMIVDLLEPTSQRLVREIEVDTRAMSAGRIRAGFGRLIESGAVRAVRRENNSPLAAVEKNGRYYLRTVKTGP